MTPPQHLRVLETELRLAQRMAAAIYYVPGSMAKATAYKDSADRVHALIEELEAEERDAAIESGVR